jgi:NitT/TauT family transport system substrate-binding protein
MTFHRISRRRFIQSSAAVAGMTLLPSPYVHAQGQLKKVTMLLDWVFQGPNAGFMVAQEKGFYKQAGLDVEIGAGKGSGSTAQLIASKTSQFGFADGFVVGNSVSKGMNIKNVASIYRRNPCAVIVLADSPIKTPKDLEGKSIGITAGSAQFQQWPAFTKGAKIDGSKISVVNVDGPGAGPALISGQLPAIAGFAQGYMPSIEIRGKKEVRPFYYADHGVNAVSNGIIVHNDLLKSDAPLVRAFVEPSIKGFLYARQNVDEAVEIVRKYLPTIDPNISKREAQYSWRIWVTPNTRGKPLGWAADADWAETLEVLKQYGGVATPPSIAQITTNEFVPEGAAFVPPQEG